MDDITKLLQMQALQVPPDQNQMMSVGQATPPVWAPQASVQPMPAGPADMQAPGKAIGGYLSHDKPTEESLFKQYGEASKRAQDDQEKGLGTLQDYINSIANKPSGINFTPLAAYIDSQVPGSKLTEAAKQMAPMSDEDRDKQLFDLQNKLQGDRGALSNARTKSLGDQLLAMRAERHQTEAERHNRAMEENGEARLKTMGANGGRVGVMLGNQAIAAGKDFESSPIVKAGKQSLSTLVRANSILDNQAKPVTGYDLDLAYNDYINSVDTSGKATEGKIQRELPESFFKDLAKFRQKFGDNMDLRSSPQGQEMIELLKKNIHAVRHDIGQAIADQASDLETTYGAVENPLVHKTVAAKMARYSDTTKNANFAQLKGEHAAAETKVWNGKTYKKVGDHWEAQ